MKNLVFTHFLVLVFFSLNAQSTLMPAATLAAMQVIQKDLSHNRDVPSSSILNYYPIYKSDGHLFIATLCKVNSSFNKIAAIRDGFDVGAIIGHIASIRIPLQLFRQNFSYPGIDYLEVAEKIAPDLDLAIKDIRADLVQKGIGLPQPYTGKNVLIGIVDWGFDYTHPVFYDTTLAHNRILAAWDQVKIIGTPPAGFTHGAVYLDSTQLTAAQHDTFSIISDYHGTHVAGIAGGSGGGTKYRGVGFDSDLIFSQMRLDLSSSLDAYEWMYEMAQAAGKRLVINNSWGGYRTYPLDGTSLVSQAIDAMSDLGVVFVFSAGNNGNINFHVKKTFNNDSIRTRIMGFDYVNDHELWGETVSMWGEPDHPFSIQLRILNNQNEFLVQSEMFRTNTTAAYVDSFLITGTDTIFYNVITDAAHPLNGRPQMTLNVKNTNSTLKSILYAEAPSGTVHFWNTRLTTYGGGNWGYGFTAPTQGYISGDKNYGIGHPGVTSSVITAAAHETNFLLTNFSSYGPRMDDVLKPDISAPGMDICSSFNSFTPASLTAVTQVTFNNKTYKFVRLSGTSMSAPMVTGVVSLLLEADPSLSSGEIKQIIINSARTDNLTGTIGPEGNVRWGYGKLDAYNAIQSITSTAVEPLSKPAYTIFPNPANDRLFVIGDLKGNETYHLFGSDGKLLDHGHFDGSLDLKRHRNGIYILGIENTSSLQNVRFAVVH